jgi:hypothetical protein
VNEVFYVTLDSTVELALGDEYFLRIRGQGLEGVQTLQFGGRLCRCQGAGVCLGCQGLCGEPQNVRPPAGVGFQVVRCSRGHRGGSV